MENKKETLAKVIPLRNSSEVPTQQPDEAYEIRAIEKHPELRQQIRVTLNLLFDHKILHAKRIVEHLEDYAGNCAEEGTPYPTIIAEINDTVFKTIMQAKDQ